MPIQFTGERFTKKNIRHSVLLAVLIADFYKRCPISVYDFSLITSLGCLSSTVHLSTAFRLREYSTKSSLLRSFTVVGMLTMLCLFFVDEFLTLISAIRI